jgi:hypothetical protein
LGWVEDNFVWDSRGRFRGRIWNDKYVISNKFAVAPIPRVPRPIPPVPTLPTPPANITPVLLPTGWDDAF